MSLENKKISVIIPTFNRAHTLARAIDSVLNQTYQDYELIVINDGSTDNTTTLLKSYKDINVLEIKNHGVSYARNRGVERASGSYIALLDSDDRWHRDKLQRQMDYLAAHPEYRCVHTDEIWIRNGVRVNQMKKHKKGGGDQFIASLSLCLISPSSILMEKNLLLELGGFREDFLVCEDYDLWLKLTAKHKIGFIEKPLITKYGGHEDQLSQKFHAMDHYRVKSMAWLVDHYELDKKQREHLLKVMEKKIHVLARGYKKHGHPDKLSEIKKYLSYLS